jgi:phosphoribosyl-ATP pyrophosphohydrolase
MIIPSMDIANGKVRQTTLDQKRTVDGGDPMSVADKFSLAGEVAVVDLDKALSLGDNSALIERLVRRYPCRVSGGIRDLDTATSWLDKGAERVVLGTAAEVSLIEKLPKSRVVAALDIRNGEVVVDGWKTSTKKSVFDRMAELKDAVGGFHVTVTDKMGTESGIDMGFVKELVTAAGKKTKVTVAGGISTPEQIAEIDKLGADAQVGMALHTGTLNLADGIIAPIKTDRPDGLWATVVVDELGQALGLVYSDLESVREAVRLKCGAYHSRTRGLWVKGLTSGNTQALHGIRLDCDRDALFFMVSQGGEGFCHNHTWSCWGDDQGLARLYRMMKSRMVSAPEGSYTKRLFEEPSLLDGKLVEEAKELASASGRERVINEAADLIFFTLAAMARSGVSLDEVEKELYKRSLLVTRHGGELKSEG